MNRRWWRNRIDRKLIVIMTAAALVAGLAGCGAPGDPASGKQVTVSGGDQTPSVKLIKVEKKTIADPQEVVAEIAASIQVDVMLKADGEVNKVFKRRGDSVKRGEVLFQLDSTDAQLQKRKAELTLHSAQNNLKNGATDLEITIKKAEREVKEREKELNKLKNSVDAGLADAKEVEASEFAYNTSLAELKVLKEKGAAVGQPSSKAALEEQVEVAQLSLKEAARKLENYRVESPISGILTDFNIENGMTIGMGTKVGQVVNINPVRIKAEITEDAIAQIRGKKQLAFYTAGQPETMMQAKIKYLADMMNAQTRTYSLELEADNKGKKLKPGTKVQLQLTNKAEEEVLTVPTTSIIREESDTFVFVYAGGQVEKRNIKLGRLNEMIQEVISGLKLGEQVVVSGQHQLKDKQKVQVTK